MDLLPATNQPWTQFQDQGRYKGFEKDPILEPSFPNRTLNLQVYMIIVHVQLKRVKKMGLSKEPTSEVKPIVNKEFLS
jgi:hypothetical protein